MANIKNISQCSCNSHRSRVFSRGIPRTIQTTHISFSNVMLFSFQVTAYIQIVAMYIFKNNSIPL